MLGRFFAGGLLVEAIMSATPIVTEEFWGQIALAKVIQLRRSEILILRTALPTSL